MTTTTRLRSDRGNTAMISVIVMSSLLTLVTLITDGAARMEAGRDATRIAGEAARTATQEMEGTLITGGAPTVDTAAGAAAARTYLRQTGATGDVTVNGDTVTVTVSVTPDLKFYDAVAGDPVTSDATSTPVEVSP